MSIERKYDFREGEILLVDKPLEWTSFDVVNKLRYPLKRKYKVKRFKVGHAGTLDPLATGLLVICTGKKTKAITQLINDEKEYTGTIQLGATTPSFDLETEIDAEYPTEHITQELVELVRTQFLGEIEQVPPIFSAKIVNGKRAYTMARKGEEVILKPNLITIKKLELDLQGNEILFKVLCSKGTYIRSLANDIGIALRSGAHLSKLRRTQSGEFSINDAKSVEEWLDLIHATELPDNQ